ncbi:MAG: hypothetical protein HYV27_00920 [Candidatus Hydrogenedentes bacterium]|nr:hypothetical protein [Candidatus Hydrogenedentota bacterium]
MTAENKPTAATPQTLLPSVLCWSLLACGAFFLMWVMLHRNGNVADDAFITLTYSKNLIAGNGFVYNHGPATLGTTSPLLALLSAAAGFLLPFLELPVIATLIATAAWAAWGWILYASRGLFNLNRAEATLIALTVYTTRFVHPASEQTLFQLLLLVTFVLFRMRQWLLCGAAAGLLTLTRGEGVLLLPLLFATHYYQERFQWRAALAGVRGVAVGSAVILGLWTLYALPEFGSVLPQTLKVKIAQGQNTGYYGRSFLPGLLVRMTTWDADGLLLRVVTWSFAVMGAWRVVRRHPHLALFGGWILLYVAGYTYLGVPSVYIWYQYPVYFIWLLLAGVGLAFAAERLLTWPRFSRPVRTALTALLLLFVLLPRYYDVWERAKDYPGDVRAESYKYVAAWLRENTKPEDTVGSGEVGYLGYYTSNKIIDMAGLISPDPQAVLDIPSWEEAVSRFAPQYLVECLPTATTSEKDVVLRGDVRYEPVLTRPLLLPWRTPPEHLCVLFRKLPQPEATPSDNAPAQAPPGN